MPNAAMRPEASNDPSAVPAKTTASSEPNTRPSTSSGVIRCNRVSPATSANALPTPGSASSTSAAAGLGIAARMAIGAPHITSPSPNGTASRRRRTSMSAAADPIRPPTPKAAVR